MNRPGDIEADLSEVRRLAASIYPSLASHGYPIDQCVEQALDVAERIVMRSVLRQIERQEDAARAERDKPTQMVPRVMR